jgi:3-phosphoshikimate 1-carboxyvinyltransferase
MALAAAALGAAGPVEIDSAESAGVTYPGFLQLLNAGIIEE